MTQQQTSGGIKQFSPQFWLVILFEFFERGAYYGMMSILSVYLTEHLHFPKESVGIIKGTIQPLLYFLPIISGAMADRFGYRRTLTIAFSLLGCGYFLTAQATTYTLVFGALVVMGIGAGTFKPIISGTIARVTTEKNSTLGFGIFYWSINLGAFLFPLILVPFLKKMDWRYVIFASAIATASMLIPTLFFYKDPVKLEKNRQSKQTNLIQTLANAFEIIYSPIVLLFNTLLKSITKRIAIIFILLLISGYSVISYITPSIATQKFSKISIQKATTTMYFQVDRNMLVEADFNILQNPNNSNLIEITIFKPLRLNNFSKELLSELHKHTGFETTVVSDIQKYIELSDKKIELSFVQGGKFSEDFYVTEESSTQYVVQLNHDRSFQNFKTTLLNNLQSYPHLRAIEIDDLDKLYKQSEQRAFFLLYVCIMISLGLGIIYLTQKNKDSKQTKRNSKSLPLTVMLIIGMFLWFLPGLSLLGRIVSFVVFITLSSLFIIDKSDSAKFVDHTKFLLMIFLYSGFWILYFQMFDSVLWYVQAYVDASSLNYGINHFLEFFGVHINWFFDVEHVIVINAGTIILLQLFISNIVKNKKALPTMISGITMGTIGMAILAISADIWIFLIGIILFSIGEMTAHPKFISYIGITAPLDKKAMYMGYLFLYGVFGSSIGGILGAKLYVHFVDNLNQPKILWLVFSAIGISTILALLLYNKYLATKEPVSHTSE
jgi:dipeptide/tripeptide permease